MLSIPRRDIIERLRAIVATDVAAVLRWRAAAAKAAPAAEIIALLTLEPFRLYRKCFLRFDSDLSFFFFSKHIRSYPAIVSTRSS